MSVTTKTTVACAMGSHIQLNGDIGGQNDLNQLNPDNIECIEIVKGATSSLYGSDAIAGVINIIPSETAKDTY